MATNDYYFNIGGHTIRLSFLPSETNSMELLPSFSPFHTEVNKDCHLLFSLTIDDSLRPIRNCELIRKFDTGNGDTLVFKTKEGGYQFIIRNIANQDCCLLQANEDFSQCHCALNGTWTMRSFGLNDALMLVYAFAGSFQQTLLIHASCIAHNGWAYPFIAKSGTGKSTHSGLWLRYIEDVQLVNDDNPIIRIIDGKPMLYGSPWSGKTPCYRQINFPLGAMTRIDRASSNSIERLAPVQAFASILPSCSSMKWDSIIYNNLCNTVTRIIETTPIYTLHCLPNEEAALLCHKTISRNNE